MPAVQQHPKPNLIGKMRSELCAYLQALEVPERALSMRANQLWHWIYLRGVTDFSAMTTISKELRSRLADHYSLSRPQITDQQISSDGTRKWLMRLENTDDNSINAPEIECVYIPDETRGTLCISSQIGCTLACTFCHTGTQKLVRNLTAGEIVSQVLIAKDALQDWPDRTIADGDKISMPEGRPISNIVLMGMGEPLYNFENVKTACAIIADNEGISISKRRITLSTSGVVPMIEQCGQEIGTMLAISLHGVRDDIRDKLVPLNKKYPIAELMAACRNYPGLSNARRITFEYVMLKDVNDSVEDAKQLVRLLKNIPAKINLIPFNPWPGTAYECSDWDTIERFAAVVNKAGYASPVRTPRGRDIMAACGQLKSDSVKKRAAARRDAQPSSIPA